jgi:hypothetical protein
MRIGLTRVWPGHWNRKALADIRLLLSLVGARWVWFLRRTIPGFIASLQSKSSPFRAAASAKQILTGRDFSAKPRLQTGCVTPELSGFTTWMRIRFLALPTSLWSMYRVSGWIPLLGKSGRRRTRFRWEGEQFCSSTGMVCGLERNVFHRRGAGGAAALDNIPALKLHP